MAKTMDLGEVKGAEGKTAYQYAKAGGYTGTEAEFQVLMAAVPTHAGDTTLHISTTAKETVEDADSLVLSDSADGGKSKRVLWSKVKELLGAVFEAEYGVTTSAEIETAYQNGKFIFCEYSGLIFSLYQRASSTQHIFTCQSNAGFYILKCNQDAWTYQSGLYAPDAHAGNHATGGADPLTPAAIGAAVQPKSVAVTLTATGWDTLTLEQTVAAAGVLDDETKQLITPCPAAGSRTAYYDAGIIITAQAADSLTFTATVLPTENLTVYVVLQGVGA